MIAERMGGRVSDVPFSDTPVDQDEAVGGALRIDPRDAGFLLHSRTLRGTLRSSGEISASNRCSRGSKLL